MSMPHASPVVDAAALAEELARFRIVPAERMSELLSGFSGGGPGGLAEYLVEQRVLTPFQAERALAGQTAFLAPGPYRLISVVRSGTLGPVFRASHLTKPGSFAVTLLPLRSLWQTRQAKKLVRQFSRFASHWGIIPLIDADSANGFHYLVWPATDDTPFSERLETSEPLPPVEVATILSQLAESLSDCHGRKLPHGAITPQTIGIAPNGIARLLDFGVGALLAQNLMSTESLFDTLSTATTVSSLLDYAAPELLADPTKLAPAADLFSLGAVGFFALTCKQQYDESSLTLRLLARQIGDKPLLQEINPEVPLELAKIIDKLLQPDPAERYTSAAELHDVLKAVAEQLDHSRPVLTGRGTPSLRELHQIEPVSQPEVQDIAPVEYGRGNGSVSWSSSASSNSRPAERDGSDASITFDLPPDPVVDAPIGPLESIDTPRSALNETAPELTPPKRDRRSALRKPSPDKAIPLNPITPPPDPRNVMPSPVQWHTATEQDFTEPDPNTSPEPIPANSVLWKKVKRNLLFWQPPTDPVAISVYGSGNVTPGKATRVTVFLHHPESADSVHTLSRAFQNDAELIGSGHLVREVAREATVAVHLSVTNAAVGKSMVEIMWRGQPLRLTFDLHVPWESPSGQAPGMVSVGQLNVRVGKAAFTLNILPRKA